MPPLVLDDRTYSQLRRSLVARYAARFGPDRAADIADEAMVRALESDYDPGRGRPDQWIGGIARNVVADEARRARMRARRQPPPARDEVEPGDDRVIAQLDAAALLAAVVSLTTEMPSEELALLGPIVAATFAGLALAARTGSEHVRLHRLRARLRVQLGSA